MASIRVRAVASLPMPMQDMIDNPNHMITLCQLKVLSAFNDNVSGFALSPSGFPDLRGVAVEPE